MATSLAEMMARDEEAAKNRPPSLADLMKQDEADPERVAFEKREEKKHPVARKIGEFGRGAYHEFGTTAIGLTDAVGDAAEAVGLPRGPFKQKEDVQRHFPHSSGSLTEQAGGLFGNVFSVPGGGAGKTVVGTVLKNAFPASVHGLARSEGEGAQRVIDAGYAGAAGGLLGGTFEGMLDRIGSGVAGVDPGARKLEKTIKAKLRDEALSGDLPIAQRVNTDNLTGKAIQKAAQWGNRGKRAIRAKDRSQRVNDDVYRIDQQEAFADFPEAAAAGERVFKLTRDPKKARKAAQDEVKQGKGLPPDKREEFQALKKKWEAKQAVTNKAYNDELADLQRVNIKEKERLVNELNVGEDKARAMNKARKKGEPRMNLKRTRAANARKRQELALTHREEVSQMKDAHKTFRKGIKDSANAEIGQFMGRHLAQSLEGIAKRDMLKKSIDSAKGGFGRYSSKSTRAAGNESTADLMSPLIPRQASDKQGFVGQALDAAGVIGGGVAGGMGGMAAGGPVGAVAGAAAGAKAARNTELAVKKWITGSAKRLKAEKFAEEVANLPPVKDPKFQRALLGDTDFQKQFQHALDSGDLDQMKALIAQTGARSTFDQEE